MEYVIIVMLAVIIILLVVLIAKSGKNTATTELQNMTQHLDNVTDGINKGFSQLKDDVQKNVSGVGELLSRNQHDQNLMLSEKITLLDRNITEKQREQSTALSEKISILDKNLTDRQREQNTALSEKISILDKNLSENQKEQSTALADKIALLDKNITEKQELNQKTIAQGITQQEERFKSFSTENNQQLEGIRASVERRLTNIQQDNTQQLDNIRKIVDEKLQDTIDKKMTQSFELVSQRLEQVYKGLGEMQTLAVSVGDLKNTLSNVKTRGILGEIQLGAILQDILSPEQYETNARVRKNSDVVVEFAIKLPAEEDGFIYLPIDSKFPCDTYNALLQAYDTGDKATIDSAQKALANRIKQEAKDIRTKYIAPPETTDFGIMFLPIEGLYAEAVKMGLIEELQHNYRVNIAGPSTMAALLNSLQMGFRTLAIQKRSSEVWQVLGAVRTEFDKFEEVLASTQKRLEMANKDLDKLVGTRTRMIRSKLKNVARLDETQTAVLLEDNEE